MRTVHRSPNPIPTLVALLLVAALGCGEPTPPAPAVASIALSPAADSVASRGTVQFQASPRDAAGQPVSGVTVAWRTSEPGVATIGPSGLASGLSVGTTTISATIGAVSGTATLRVIPAAVSIRLIGPLPTARVGHRTQLGVSVRDDAGNEIAGRQIEWTSGSQGVATVDAAGLVTGVSEGRTLITVRLGSLADSATLVVGPTLAVTATDSMVAPGEPFRIVGGGLDQALVEIAARRLAPTIANDTMIVVPIPLDLFGPCIADTTTTTISLTAPGATPVNLRRPVAERPMVAALARGRHADLSTVLTTGCRVAIDSAGDYVAMVYAAEATDSIVFQQDSLALLFETAVIGSSPAPASALPPVPVRSLPPRAPGLASDVVPSAPATAVSCPVPTRIGETIRMATARNAQGRVSAIAYNGPPVEAWELVGLAARVAFFIDSTTKRVMASDPRVVDLINRTVAFADTGAVPFLERMTRGFPDKGGDGRVIAYITTNGAFGAAGIALPWSSYRADCGVQGPAGESVLLDLFLAPSPVPPFVEPNLHQRVVMHELAHIADLGWYPPHFGGHAVIFEGFATFLEAVYPYRNDPEPFATNRDTYAEYFDSILGCFVYPGVVLQYFYEVRHTVGCHLAGQMFARRRAATGESFRDMAVRWSSTDMPANVPLWIERYLGTPGRGVSMFAEWLMSWYTDDFVPGVAAELQQPYWNSRAGWARYLSSLPDPFVATHVGDRAARYPLRLGRVDARYFELRASRATRLSLRGAVPPEGRGKVGLLLVRR